MTTATTPLPLWPDITSLADEAALTVYPCAAGDGATVLICPGGGYRHLAEHEGPAVAHWLNEQGFHAAVLRYRLAPKYQHPAMIHDAQRAIRLLRAGADEWGIRPDAVAVLGFSAGGHLASTLAVHHGRFACEHDDLAGRISARPDAAVLCYPVIDLAGEAAHTGSRSSLLGPEADGDLVALLSTHRHVSPGCPPTFLWHTADDAVVPLANSLAFADACQRQGVPVELHVFEAGRHGLGLAEGHPGAEAWPGLGAAFLRRHMNGQAEGEAERASG